MRISKRRLIYLPLILFHLVVHAQETSPSLHFGVNLGTIHHNYSPHQPLAAGFLSFVKFKWNDSIQGRIFSSNFLNYSSIHELKVYGSSINARSFYTSTFFSPQFIFVPHLFNNFFSSLYVFIGPCAGLISQRFSKTNIIDGQFRAYHKFTSTNFGFELGIGNTFHDLSAELLYHYSKGNKFDVLGGPYNSITQIYQEKSSNRFVQHIFSLNLTYKVF